MASFCRKIWVRRYQTGRTILDFNETRDDVVPVASAGLHTDHLHFTPERQPHQCLSTQFTGQMLFLLPNQQCQNTEGKNVAQSITL